MQLDVLDSSAVDRFGCFLDDTLCEHDAFRLEAGGPLEHLFADLALSDNQQSLDGVRPLAEI